MNEVCNVYWGSHGCHLPPGSHKQHICSHGGGVLCSEYDEVEHRVRFNYSDGPEPDWSDWDFDYPRAFRL